ncbi:MAG: hypothetical protein HYY46_17545 [Deltaproteobacteria bacterium]|nr:hypothetical protein [Deltaproteobacteria bacterium]
MERALAFKESFDTPDSTMPFAVESEYLETQRRRSVHEGAIGLMLAILEDAVNCYMKYAAAKDRRGGQQFKEAEEWIFERHSAWLFSFENICEILGIDPEYVRHGLLRWKQKMEQGGRGAEGGKVASKNA